MTRPWNARLPQPPAAVLFDRDGTLVVDVPYLADPQRVVPMPGAARLLTRLREAGIPCGIVSNQSGIGRGLVTPDQLDAVTRRVQEFLGPFDVILSCPHLPTDGCACRKPAPGMVLEACLLLGVAPECTVVVGDTGADMDAALAAGAHGILVPVPLTRAAEVARAPVVARTLAHVETLLFPGPHPAVTARAIGAASLP